jgi:tRNA (mo5U34)-methyltransferase
VVPLFELGVIRCDAVSHDQSLLTVWNRAFDSLPQWRAVVALLERNIADHGDSRGWLHTIATLPRITTHDVEIDSTIRIGRAADCSAQVQALLRSGLMSLQPWRKGPFSLFGVDIDSEWRSDWKWRRVAPHLSSLVGRTVLDVGCGNGYYGWRMCAAGARCVIGVDPTLIYLMQYLTILKYLAPARPEFVNALLPARLEELPAASAAFDTVFSMGVLYHRRDPHAHLRDLHAHLRPGGELVLETLTVTDESTRVLTPTDRYARMRNVWHIPNRVTLERWLIDAGFSMARSVDSTATTRAEQRTTGWMQFESLDEALDPDDPTRTIEGYPAPVRSIVIAQK